MMTALAHAEKLDFLTLVVRTGTIGGNPRISGRVRLAGRKLGTGRPSLLGYGRFRAPH